MSITSGMMSSNNQECETPQDFFDALNAEFGFTLDAATARDRAGHGGIGAGSRRGIFGIIIS